jgi:hypothetical protein
MNNRRKLLAVILLLLFATSVGAQEFSDPLARQLTDFLPTYTPFTPPEPPDRYFPDDVGKKVANAIAEAYLQNPQAVEQQAQEIARHDSALVAEGAQATGLASRVSALAAPPADPVSGARLLLFPTPSEP